MRRPMFMCISVCCLIGAGRWPAQVAAVESVRIDASTGAPQIIVDGKPVRARIFFGTPGVQWPMAKPTGQGPKLSLPLRIGETRVLHVGDM
jgi:hypothetical protein